MFKLILAGILAIPCLLLTIVTAPIIAILSIPSLLLLLFRKEDNNYDNAINVNVKDVFVSTTKSKSTCADDHVIIFGGSSGIGLAIAKECCAIDTTTNNLKITILARNKEKLDQAKKEIYKEVATNKNTNTTIKVEAISVSVSDFPALEIIAKQIAKKEERTIIFNCAGIPYTVDYEKIPIEMYDKLCQTNLLGSMYVTRAFLPHIDNGCLVLCSSAAGQVGMYGYTAYSPTKFALRGFAEAMHAEMIRSKPGVSIQVAFPIDTDTPGYQEEYKMMPEITKVLNDTAGLAKAEDTAKIMVASAFAKNPNFQVYFTPTGWMLSNLTAGMSPVSSLFDALAQVALGGLFRFITLFIVNDWWRTIRQFQDDKDTKDDKRKQP